MPEIYAYMTNFAKILRTSLVKSWLLHEFLFLQSVTRHNGVTGFRPRSMIGGQGDELIEVVHCCTVLRGDRE